MIIRFADLRAKMGGSAFCKKAAATVLMVLGFAGVSHSQILYNATATGTASTQASFHYMQQLTLVGANTSYSISSMVFGINWADTSADQGLILDFYTGANLSATAANALTGATFINEAAFGITAPAAVGNYTYTLTFGTPIVVPSNTFSLVAFLTNAAGTTYSTGGINGRFTLGAGVPSVGSSPGFVWSDTNLDGVFTGAEQTKFGNATAANIRMSITATAVPEPSAVSLLMGALVIPAIWHFRRRSQGIAQA